MAGSGGRVAALRDEGLFKSRLHFENPLDLDGDVPRERAHADGAPGADSVVRAPDFSEEFAAAVDDLGVVVEVGSGVHHAEEFDHALHAVEAAEVFPEGGEHGQTDDACGISALLQGQLRPDPAFDQAAIGQIGTVAGNVGRGARDDDGLIDGCRTRRRRELQGQLG